MGVKVTAPDGRRWEISRHPRWPRLRELSRDGWDVAPVDLRSRAAVREVADELRRGVPAEPEDAE